MKNINVKEYEERKVEIYRAFRPEYRKALVDVRLNAKITFYKWVIDEFYIQIGNKEKAEEILKIVFGKNEDDGSISRTFDKLKYDRGKREWNTFKHLFQNELHDKELMNLLIYLTKQELHIEDFEWNIVKINETWLKGLPAMKSQLTPLCYIEKDGCYLMLHRVTKKNDINHDKWIGVGGHFEEHESPEDCLLREVKEETGLMLDSFRFWGIYLKQKS